MFYMGAEKCSLLPEGLSGSLCPRERKQPQSLSSLRWTGDGALAIYIFQAPPPSFLEWHWASWGESNACWVGLCWVSLALALAVAVGSCCRLASLLFLSVDWSLQSHLLPLHKLPIAATQWKKTGVKVKPQFHLVPRSFIENLENVLAHFQCGLRILPYIQLLFFKVRLFPTMFVVLLNC